MGIMSQIIEFGVTIVSAAVAAILTATVIHYLMMLTV